MLAHWLQKLIGPKRRSSVAPRRRPAVPFRPLLETLEDRLAPATFTVTNLSDSPTPGSGSLRDAINTANLTAGANTINFAPGLSGTISLANGSLTLSNTTGTTTIAIQGPGSNVITVNGSNAFTVFAINAGLTASISGLTISGGSSPTEGGGIDNDGALVLTNSTITGNTCTDSGAGILSTGYLNIQNCLVNNNTDTATTGDGEGGGVDNEGTMYMKYCIVDHNQAGEAGGIITEQEGGPGIATIVSSTISNNTATGAENHEGGGLGAGVLTDDGGTLTMLNCTISGNNAGTFNGGGLYNSVAGSSTSTITNCTIANNIAAAGGGIGLDAGTVSLVNTIVAQNSSPDLLINSGGTLSATNSVIGDGTGQTSVTNGSNGNIVGTTANPAPALLAPLGYYGGQVIQGQGLQTMALLPGSAAINSAGPGAPATDERGIARPQQNASDIGAFESRGFIITIVSGNPQSGLLNQAYTKPLIVSVSSAFGEPVVGGEVTFTGPSNPNGPEVTFANLPNVSPVPFGPNNDGLTNNGTTIRVFITGASATASFGQAGTIATANNVAGQFQVVASASGANAVIFNLSNILTYLAVGADAGSAPEVKVYNSITGALVFDFLAFAPSFTGGVRVAVGDVNGDGYFDIICGAGPGGGPEVRVFSGKDLTLLQDFYAFAPTFTGGVNVAAGDVNGDGKADIIVGAGPGGGPQVIVFSGADHSILANFFAFPVSFTGGVTVAAGDLNGDGFADVIVGAGPGGSPQVNVYNGADIAHGNTNPKPFSFFAFPVNFTGGVFVAAGNLVPGGLAQLIVGAGAGGLPEVNVFDGQTFQLIDAFFASPPQVPKVDSQLVNPGVRVTVNCEFCPHPTIVTGEGPFTSPTVAQFDGSTFLQTSAFFAFDPLYQGGIFVGGA